MQKQKGKINWRRLFRLRRIGGLAAAAAALTATGLIGDPALTAFAQPGNPAVASAYVQTTQATDRTSLGQIQQVQASASPQLQAQALNAHQVPIPKERVYLLCRQSGRQKLCASAPRAGIRAGMAIVSRLLKGKNLQPAGEWVFEPDGKVLPRNTAGTLKAWMDKYKGIPRFLIHASSNYDLCLDKASPTSTVLVFGSCGQYTWAESKGNVWWSFWRGPPPKTRKAPKAMTLSPANFGQAWILSIFPHAPKAGQVLARIYSRTILL